jgi:hypothetical protein
VQALSQLPSAPVHKAAVFYTGPKFLRVAFNQLLAGGSVDPSNWFADVSGIRYQGAQAALVTSYSVYVRMLAQGPTFFPNSFSYSPPPFDITNRFAVPAAAIVRKSVTLV